MTIALNILQFTTESHDNIQVYKGWVQSELSISLVILVAHTVNSGLVLDHFLTKRTRAKG
jgi:hypothetical protein